MKLQPRQTTWSTGGTSKTVVIVVVVLAVLLAAASAALAIWYFRYRGKAERPSFRATWRNFKPRWIYTCFQRSRAGTGGRGNGDAEANNGVDRHTSVRSIMTLPAYSAVPRENENVIGREGQRAGMDTVVEFPETNEEVEERREEEQSGLYAIRLVRREEAAARASRRQRRREAELRGNRAELQAIRLESRRARRERELNGSTALINEHDATPRDRRVSSVSYANLGVARHDGSRVRANSAESQQLPLLETAGSLGISEPVRPWVSRESYSTNRLNESTSNLSLQSYGSSYDSAWSDGESDFETVSLNPTRTRATSHSGAAPSLRPGSSLAGNAAVNSLDPVDHDTGPPAYTSPVEGRPPVALGSNVPPTLDTPSDALSLPTIERLPSIRITQD